MRFMGLTGAGLAALLVLPAAADGYRHTSPATSYSYNTHTSTSSSPCVTSCCCGREVVRTYTTAPVVRRYTQTYTRIAPPDCYHTSHTVHAPRYQPCGAHTSGHVTSGYVTNSHSYGDQHAYDYEYGGDSYAYEDEYYAEDYYGDTYADEGYYAPYPATSYGAELSLDRENPWNGYRR